MPIYTLTPQQAEQLPEHPDRAVWPIRVTVRQGMDARVTYADGLEVVVRTLGQADPWLTSDFLTTHYTRHPSPI